MTSVSSRHLFIREQSHFRQVTLKVYSFPLSSLKRSQAKSLRKHAYSNIMKILPPKNENFQIKKIKNSVIFHIPAQNIDCGYSLEPPRRGGSNQYPQSMF